MVLHCVTAFTILYAWLNRKFLFSKYLGEVLNKNKERWEIQFKGAGTTPYSRSADGRKVLRSSLREFLCSEVIVLFSWFKHELCWTAPCTNLFHLKAMFSLGIPTTRGGTCVTSDSKVIRDILYNGNPILEKCTIILRIARTFIRYGLGLGKH